MIKKVMWFMAAMLMFAVSANAYVPVRLGPEYIPDPTRSRSVSGGEIYIGVVDTDPTIEINQIQMYVQEEDGDIVAVTQPINTGAGGVPVYNGSPVALLAAEDYSLTVLDKHGAQMYYVPDSDVSVTVDISGPYFPEHSAPDQGVTGDDNTIKYYIDQAAGDIAVIQLLHNSGEAKTEYIYLTDETSPSTVIFVIDPGAVLKLANGVTVTIHGELDILPTQDVFDWVGTGKVEGLTGTHPEWWESNTTPGVTDMAVAIKAAIEAGDALILSGDYFSSVVATTIAKPLTIVGNDATITSSTDVFDITFSFAESVDIRGIRFISDSVVGGTAIKLDFPIQSLEDGFFSVDIHDITMDQLVWTDSWDYGIDMVNPKRVNISNFKFTGCLDDKTQSDAGIRITVDHLLAEEFMCTNFVLSDSIIFFTEKGVAILSEGNFGFEGVKISKSDFVGCVEGIYVYNADNEPDYSIDQCHISFSSLGIRFLGVQASRITNNLLFKTEAAIAFEFGVLIQSGWNASVPTSWNTVSNNQFVNIDYLTGAVVQSGIGIEVINSDYNNIYGNQFNGITTSIFLNDCTQAVVNENVITDAGTAGIGIYIDSLTESSIVGHENSFIDVATHWADFGSTNIVPLGGTATNPDGQTYVDMKLAKLIFLENTAATTIDTISGTRDVFLGDKVQLYALNGNTTIDSWIASSLGPPFLRLKAGATSVTLAAEQLIEFVYAGGSWTECNRNF